MRRTACLIAAIVWAASGCGSGEAGSGDALDGSTAIQSGTSSRSEPTTTTHSESTDAAPSDCAAPDQDVANEPDWRQYATFEEWTRDGCPVRIDFLAERVDSDCDLNWPQIIVTGNPLGTPYETAADAHQYLRNDRDLRA